jgi:hypothetical protein
MRRSFLYVMLFACACRQPAEHGLGDKIGTVDVGNDSIIDMGVVGATIVVVSRPETRDVDEYPLSLLLIDTSAGAERRVVSSKINGFPTFVNGTLYIQRTGQDKEFVSIVDVATGRRRDVASGEDIDSYFPRTDLVVASKLNGKTQLLSVPSKGETREIPIVNIFPRSIDMMAQAADGVVLASAGASAVMKLIGDKVKILRPASPVADYKDFENIDYINAIAATSTQTLWNMISRRRLFGADDVTGKISTVVEYLPGCAVTTFATTVASPVIAYTSDCETSNSLVVLWPGHEPKTIITTRAWNLFFADGILYWLEDGPRVPTEGTDKTHPTYVLKRLALEPPTA